MSRIAVSKMAAPRNKIEVFRLIDAQEDKLADWGTTSAGDALLEKEFQKYSHLPFMRGVTIRDYDVWAFK